MRKDRNAFFEQSNYNKAFYPTPNMNMGLTPSTMSTSSQSFYQGPNVYNNDVNDLESRLSRMERQINRLDARISKLEGNSNITTTENYVDNTDMYMI